MQPVTCAAADVPRPPRPAETRRHLALTQLQKSQENRASSAALRPGVSQRPNQGPHLTQGEEQMVGVEPRDFLRHCSGSTEATEATIAVVTSPSLPVQQPPPTTLAPPTAAA